LVVVVTVGVLALAIYFFLQQRAAAPPAVEPSASTPAASNPAANATTAASAGATILPFVSVAPTTPVTSVSPSAPPPTAERPTPAPTLFVPPVVSGPGYITFGTTANDQLEITDPKTTFGVDEPIVWSASLSDVANSTDLSILTFRLDATQPTGQLLVRQEPVTPNVQGAHLFLRHVHPIGSTEGAGLYTIEYVRGDQVLAQGSVLVQ
jgi:hypothetical protein